jgi:hypothetical protein
MDSVRVITDLVELLSEEQLVEYAKKNNLEKYHPAFRSPRFKQVKTTLQDLIEEDHPDREELLRAEILDHIFYGFIPAHGGMIFQKQVSRWLKGLDGTIVPEHRVRSTQVGRKYIDIDVHVTKKDLIGKTHVWAEIKVPRVTKRMVDKLLRDATDVHESKKQNLCKWAPDILMMVTMRGFTKDAKELANQSRIYCVHYKSRNRLVRGKRPSYHFVGELQKEDYENNVFSNYPRYR